MIIKKCNNKNIDKDFDKNNNKDKNLKLINYLLL